MWSCVQLLPNNYNTYLRTLCRRVQTLYYREQWLNYVIIFLRLSSFPKGIFSLMKNLQILDLNKNRFVEIQGLSFHGLDNLKILRLRRNQIEYLMDGAFFGLSRIEELSLDRNKVPTVNKGWLYGLTTLRYLSLSYNRVSSSSLKKLFTDDFLFPKLLKWLWFDSKANFCNSYSCLKNTTRFISDQKWIKMIISFLLSKSLYFCQFS